MLNQGLDEAEGAELLGVLRAVARLHRRLGDLERAREHLVLVLAQAPADARARGALNALLEREERWEELDASLEKEARVALKAAALRRAARATARRARVWSQHLGDPARAALRFGQASQYAEQAGDGTQAFLHQSYALEALVASGAPQRALDDAARRLVLLAGAVGLTERAQALVAGLGLAPVRAPGPARTETAEIATVAEARLEEAPSGEAEVVTGEENTPPESGEPAPATQLEVPIAQAVAPGGRAAGASASSSPASSGTTGSRAALATGVRAPVAASVAAAPSTTGTTGSRAALVTGARAPVAVSASAAASTTGTTGSRAPLTGPTSGAPSSSGTTGSRAALATGAPAPSNTAASWAPVATAGGTPAVVAAREEVAEARSSPATPSAGSRAARGVASPDVTVPRSSSATPTMGPPAARGAAGPESAGPRSSPATPPMASTAARTLAVPETAVPRSSPATPSSGSTAARSAASPETGVARSSPSSFSAGSAAARPGVVSPGTGAIAEGAAVRASPATPSAGSTAAGSTGSTSSAGSGATRAGESATPGSPASPLAAPPARPSNSSLDLATARKLEAQFVGRGDWAGLEAFYLDRAARSPDAAQKAVWFEKLAEVLETELEDGEGAAAAWGEVAALRGDDHARREQLRLLGRIDGGQGVQEALDEGVARAEAPQVRAQALVTRAETAQARGDMANARADFTAALAAVPSFLPALAGLAEVAAAAGDAGPTRQLEAALLPMGRGAAGRAGWYRRLARVADGTLGIVKLARLAWAEVWVESPDDREAQARLLVAARTLRDDPLTEQLLRTALGRDPRGEGARAAWLELVALQERQRRLDEALATLERAVQEDPAHLGAWMALGDRRLSRGAIPAAVEALEHAAAAAQGHQRMTLWRRLERLARDRLDDLDRADVYAARAARVKEDLGPDEATVAGPLGGPLLTPRPRPSRPTRNPFDEVAVALGAQREDEVERAPRLYSRVPLVLEGPVGATAGLEQTGEAPLEAMSAGYVESAPVPAAGQRPAVPEAAASGDVIVDPSLWADAAKEVEAARAVELGDPSVSVPSSFGPSPQRALGEERQALFEYVRANPVEPDGYKALAEHFDNASDPSRSSLMLEIARALEGDPNSAPRTPRLILTEADRQKLRHPALRGEAGELLTLVGLPLCRLYPATGAAASEDEFSLESGKGAKVAAEALLAAVRLLGVRSPDVFITPEPGAPFTAVHTTVPRLLVSRLVVKKEHPEASLRFYAGRALFSLSPDLLLLRTVRREQLIMALQVVAEVASSRQGSAEARVVKGALTGRAFDRVRQLWPKVGRTLDLAQLTEAARHSVNRAGLVVCGGVAPALEGLRSKKARASEVVELVRFAASETYLQLKGRRIGAS